MQFGILVSNSVSPGVGSDVQFDELTQKARLARQLGYSSFWLGGGPVGARWHMLTPLARLAVETGDMELGSVVLLPLYNPVELAEQVSTLDAITGGRFTLGVGLGFQEYQYRAFGVPKTERLHRFMEYLDVMKRLWTEETVTYHGRFINIDGVPGAPKPVAQPHPKILLAVNLDAGVLRAPRLGRGWLTSSRATLRTIGRQLGLYREACEEAGVPAEVVAFRSCFVAHTKKEAVDTIQPFAAPQYRGWVETGAELHEIDRIDRPFEEILEGRFIIGSPEDCALEVQKCRDLGLENVVLGMEWHGMPLRHTLDSMRRFAEEVLPRFQ